MQWALRVADRDVGRKLRWMQESGRLEQQEGNHDIAKELFRRARNLDRRRRPRNKAQNAKGRDKGGE